MTLFLLLFSLALASAAFAAPQKLSVAVLPFLPGSKGPSLKPQKSLSYELREERFGKAIRLEAISWHPGSPPRPQGWQRRMPWLFVPATGSGYQWPLELVPWDTDHPRYLDPSQQPFDSKFPGEEKELGVALAEALRSNLKQVKAFFVLEPGPIEQTLEQDQEGWRKEDLLQLGKTLKAEIIVSGRFAREWDRLWLKALFFDVRSGKMIFSQEVEGPINELFTLEWRITKGFIHHLGLSLSASEEKRLAFARQRPTFSLKAYVLYAQGRRLMTLDQKEDYEKAIDLFRKAVQTDDRFALAHYELGLAFRKVDAPRALWLAIDELNKAVHYDPQFAEAHKALGAALLASQDRLYQQLAIEAYQKAVALDPKDAEAYVGLGEVRAATGRFDEAIIEYRKAVGVDPDNPRGRYKLGKGYANKGLYDEALAEYQKALALAPDFVDTHLALGELYAEQGLYQEALKHYRRAMELEPNRPQAYYGLASVLEDVDEEQALSAWKYYIHIASQLPSEREWLDIAKRHVKKLEEKKR